MLKNLRLTRPLAFIDLETTGTDVQVDRIVEVAVLKLHPDGRRDARCRRVNPGILIPPAASAIHGIFDCDVEDEPPFGKLARGLLRFLEGSDLCGFNLKRFDLRVLVAEFSRVGLQLSLDDRSLIDPLEIFHERERRDLSAALRFYCGLEHEGAHGAAADARATAEILDAMLERYSDLPRVVDELGLAFRDPNCADIDGKFIWNDGRLCFNFGKHKGRPLDEVALESPDYLQWILAGSFLDDTKDLVREVYRRERVGL